MHYTSILCSEIGIIEIKANDNFLIAINFLNQIVEENSNELTRLVKKQLLEYFAGNRKKFDNFKVDTCNSHFSNLVLNKLLDIEYGQTISYQELANLIDQPKAARAIGNALNKNKLPIIYPCHRIIKKDGNLGGFKYQKWRKEYLLELEAKNLL